MATKEDKAEHVHTLVETSDTADSEEENEPDRKKTTSSNRVNAEMSSDINVSFSEDMLAFVVLEASSGLDTKKEDTEEDAFSRSEEVKRRRSSIYDFIFASSDSRAWR